MATTTLLKGGRKRRKKPPNPFLLILVLVTLLAVIPLAIHYKNKHQNVRQRETKREKKATPLKSKGSSQRSGYAAELIDKKHRVKIHFATPPRGGLLFDIKTGKVLWERNAYKSRPIASVTKMMSAIIIVDHIKPNTKVKITREALHYKGSGVGVLPKNKSVKAEPLLNGMLLPSGNDAAIALAQKTAGNVHNFVTLMNKEAQKLGLKCSHFSSPHGLVDRGNYSCPIDLAILAREVLRRPRLSKIVKRRQVAVAFPTKGGRLFLTNTNPLLRTHYSGTTGIKTGYTKKSGRSFVASARRGNTQLGVVLIHSPDTGEQARQLLDLGFKHLSKLKEGNQNKLIAKHNGTAK